MPNQHQHNRKWREEIAETASRLQVCVLLPRKLAALQRIKFVCMCGNTTETYVHRFISRQFCCKSKASASRPKESYAAGTRQLHKLGLHVHPRTQDQKDRIANSVSRYHQSLKESGETSPSWGWKVKMEDPNRLDTLYFVIVADVTGKLHYKIGRSFYGPSSRLQRSLVTVIATWQGPHWQVWWAERTLLDRCSRSRSSPTPTLDSAGGTECFSELNPREVVSLADLLLLRPAKIAS